MSTVEFRDIVKRYGALTILERLNLKVEDGEFLVLLGPSGCGKTTLPTSSPVSSRSTTARS
jgi:multiple sugar transport system ATP-binding protein